MIIRIYSLFLVLFFLPVIQAFSAEAPFWTDVGSESVQARSTRAKPVLPLMPDKYRLLQLDISRLRASLKRRTLNTSGKTDLLKSKLDSMVIPLPDGTNLSLILSKNSVMAPELAALFPEIKTWRVEARYNNGIYGAVDITSRGFHAMLYRPDGSRIFIDPRRTKDTIYYISYLDTDYHPAGKQPHQCSLKQHTDFSADILLHTAAKTASRAGTNLRTYRLAVAATGEYTAYHGGTVAGAMGAIVTTVSRVNTIYERDLAVKLELVANNQLLIHTDTTTYSNNDSGAMLSQNQTQLDTIIGSANYDIGHVVSTGGGGVAYLGSVCSNIKAGGVTGSPIPETDAFDIDFVAHEMGHQFGANHTFNSETGSCGGGNRNATTAVEPGSGTSIMAYAGICGATNDTQPHSDAMFHIFSIVEATNFIEDSTQGGSCGTQTPLSNHQPVAQAGADYTIPANTPFVLTGSGSDADSGDVLTYSWEQIDAGTASDINVVLSDNAIFRTFLPKDKPVRYFPALSSLFANTTSKGETLPTLARSMNFSLVVRDQHGGVNADEMVVNVVDSSGFKITSHGSAATFKANDSTTVTWDVAGTTAAPVNCSAVNISLTTDQGQTFVDLLGSPTANDGSETVTIPAGVASSNKARFKVQCANNIFFDLSDADLTTQSLLEAGTPVLSNTGSNNVADPGETIRVNIPLTNQTNTVISAVSGQLGSTQGGVQVANSNYPDIQPQSASTNSTPYQITIPANAQCGASIPITLNTAFTINGNNTNKLFNLGIPTGQASPGAVTASPGSAIPDNDSTGVTSTITLSNVGIVGTPAISVDVNITHSYRGDLRITLTSPQGTKVVLKQNSSDAASNIIGNYPADFVPVDSLDAFNGENLDGDWKLEVVDTAQADAGTLNSWTLHYTRYVCDTSFITDGDSDGVVDALDNCPVQANPRQSDSNSDGVGDLCTPYVLLNDSWRQITMPATLGSAHTMADVFADDLPVADLGTVWSVFGYDTATNTYTTIGLSDVLEHGKAYWVIQKTGATVNIDLPAGIQETAATAMSTQCTSTAGCYEISLATKANQATWNMVGNPFEFSANLNNVRVITDSGVCADADGCTLNEASAANIVNNKIFSYNGTVYDQLGDGAHLAGWQGGWVATLAGANGLNPKLLFPLP